MAHNPGTYRQGSQHNQPQSSPPLPSYHTSQGSGQPAANTHDPVNHSSNFGDDMQRVETERPIRHSQVPRHYRSGSNAAMQNQELYMGAQSPTYPPRNTAYHTGGGGGYQPQEVRPAQPNPQSTYNPQRYGAPPVQFSPQPNNPNTNAFSTNAQSYNPAAYHSSGPQYQSAHVNQFSAAPHTAVHPPPPPPRPVESSYGTRVSPQIGSDARTQYPAAPASYTHRQQPLPPLPSGHSQISGHPYTPPAPPPPPFSPVRDAYLPNSPSATSSQQSSARSIRTQDGQRASSRPLSLNSPLPSLSHHPPTSSPRIGSPVIHRRPVPTNHSLPPTPGTPGPTPPQHSPHRSDTTGRHPHERPLPGPPPSATNDSDYFSGSNGNGDAYDEVDDNDDLMREVEAAVMGRPLPSSSRRSPRIARTPAHASIDETQALQPPYSDESHNEHAAVDHTHTNGHVRQASETQYIDHDVYSDDSDAEAEAGLAAMHMAEAQDAADEARRQSGGGSHRMSYGSQPPARYQSQSAELSSDSDVHVDMDSYGGGFPGTMHYGEEDQSQDTRNNSFAPARASQRFNLSGATLNAQSSLYDYPIPGQESIHPFAPASVDTGITGGLSEPGANARRLSFEDGDEVTLAESEETYDSANQSPSGGGMPDMFFYPSSRPLPAAPVDSLSNQRVPSLMPAGTYRDSERERVLQYDQYGRPTFPAAPSDYQLTSPSGTPLPRSSNSLMSQGSTPQTIQPIRSKTDADRAKFLKQQQQMRSGSVYGSDVTGDASINQSAELLGLPQIPAGKRRKFNPAKLSTHDFKKCSEPWALSSIVDWVKEMSEDEADLKEHAIVDGIVALFTHKVPTMNTADAENLGAKVVRAMFSVGALLKDEEWVKFGSEPMSGVLFQLTGTGCYSPRVHTTPLPGRCYSHHCMRTLKKINLQTQVLEPQRKIEDWVTFYKLKKEDIENINKKEIERQNNLHEIVMTEDNYMDQLNVLQVLYRDELFKWQPPIIAPKKREGFLRDVFGRIDAIKQVNEDFLLAQLKYRQQEQGPWIVGFSDIFREWIRKAKQVYIEYAAGFPNATFMIRQEADRNMLFRQFLDQMRDHERSKRLGWDTYLKAPITRLQRYNLLLKTVNKHMVQESEEKTNLNAAIVEIDAVTKDCNVRVEEMSKHVELSELATKLVLRPGMVEQVQFNLTHLGRKILYQGDLQRMGTTKFSWLESHVILFDHYFVLAKTIAHRDLAGGLRSEKYDVSKLPIPMDLLLLESVNDDPVVKSTMKGIGTVTTVTTKAAPVPETRTSRQSMSNSSGGPGTLAHMNTASSAASIQTNGAGKSIVPTTVIDSPREADNIMYPFRVRHLGRPEVYVLYAPSYQNREEWCQKIVEAKTGHAQALQQQNAEPFRMRVVADTAFAYDGSSSTPQTITIKDTPLDRAIRAVEKKFEGTPRPVPVCRAAVNCATSFTPPDGTPMVAIGTDYGVYISDSKDPRGWTRAIAATRVTQLAVLEEFSLFLLLADKSLIAHHLDTVLPHATSTANNSSSSSTQRAPQKLSGARDIGFFAHGRMKDRHLIFYKKREGVSSIFKVLEPVYQRSGASGTANMRSRFGMRRGATEFFRDFDDFYIPSETFAINLFQSSLAISTQRGMEVMTLDKKMPLSIPDLKAPDCAQIAQRLQGQRPLGMFRLSESEFLLVFEGVGIYVNKHGDVSRAVVMDYVGKAKQACLAGGRYLILVDHQGLHLEVRNAVNGRLRQIITGRDVRLLDDGAGKGGTVKICMQHPEAEKCQIVLEMLVKEGLKE